MWCMQTGDAGILRAFLPGSSGEGNRGEKGVHPGGASAGELWAGQSGVKGAATENQPKTAELSDGLSDRRGGHG